MPLVPRSTVLPIQAAFALATSLFVSGPAFAQQPAPQPVQPATTAAPAPVPAQSAFPSFSSVRVAPPGVAVGERPSLPAAGTPVPPVVVQPPSAAPAPAAAPGQAAGAAPAKAARPAKPKSQTVKTAVTRANDGSLARAAETRGVGIAVLVNDEPITGYEIDQRQRFMALSANISDRAQANFKRAIQDPSVSERLKGMLGEIIKANPGKSKEQILALFEERKKQFALGLQKQAVENARSSVLPTLRKQALDELVEERLKLQEAKKLNVLATDEDVSRIIKSIAEKNKMTEVQFAQHLSTMGTDIEAMRSRFRSTLSWNEVIKRKYGHQIAISERDVERMVSQGPAADDQLELQVQRIVLPISGKLAQKAIDQRVAEAEGLRAKFRDCKSMAGLTAGIDGAKFEDLGKRKAGTIAEPTRSFLVNAKDGEMVPATVGGGGVELYAVCGRDVVKGDDQKRTAALEELRQKEFELFARRHLHILRDDATCRFVSETPAAEDRDCNVRTTAAKASQ